MFPGSATQCERALFKAVKSGEFDTVEKLVKFYKGDLRFVNATYRESGKSSEIEDIITAQNAYFVLPDLF